MKMKIWSAGAIVAVGLFSLGLHSARTGIDPAAAATAAPPADGRHTFAVHGVGALTCSTMTGALLNGDAGIRGTLASWMLGYVSAMNRGNAAIYDATPVQEDAPLVNMVVGVCAHNPSLAVETVVFAVFSSLEKAKVPVESPDISMSAGNNRAVIRKSTLLQMQSYLAAKKYMPASDANGAFGPATQAALQKFQAAQHLPVSGLPDPATVIRALVETPTK